MGHSVGDEREVAVVDGDPVYGEDASHLAYERGVGGLDTVAALHRVHVVRAGARQLEHLCQLVQGLQSAQIQHCCNRFSNVRNYGKAAEES